MQLVPWKTCKECSDPAEELEALWEKNKPGASHWAKVRPDLRPKENSSHMQNRTSEQEKNGFAGIVAGPEKAECLLDKEA